MARTRSNHKATEFHWRTLIKYFILWKAILLAVACASPGPGYDTSTQILFSQYDEYEQPARTLLGRCIEHLVLRLTRWDGIYFSSSAARGHVNEQDWAFSWALARSTSFLSRVLFSSLSLPLVVKDAFTGILISNASHFAAVIALHQLTYHIIPSTELTKRQAAFAASCLHIISPAGLFLSAPYGESTFAMLNFSGALSYVLAIKARFQSKPDVMTVAMWTLLAGGCFGLSATIRSNGVLAGLFFAWDAIEVEGSLQPTQLIRNFKVLGTFAATICAGILVGIGFAAPQVVAYVEYCTGENSRPWCTKLIPSIYSWVQDYYWEVGFLRYWTLNNLPLFLLAGPMLLMLLYTGFIGMASALGRVHRGSAPVKVFDKVAMDTRIYNHVMPRMALQQLILAIMAATSFHVQIINRISSGCPVWYVVLASVLCTSSSKETRSHVQQQIQPLSNLRFLSEGSNLQWIVRGMVMYAVIQGGLYASFLPPA